jgi:DNA-binding transcriptional MerR regulator
MNQNAQASKYLRTSEVARAVGVHPNTVRLYEEWGFLPPIPRARNGYRRFTSAHVDQMILARLAMRFTWLGGETRRTAREIIFQAAGGNLGSALEQSYRLLVMVQSERVQAEAAVTFLERWAQGMLADVTMERLRIGQTAQLLGVSTDRLRNWERNGLIKPGRETGNNYRSYGAVEIGRLRVIRALCGARYSLMSILRMLQRLDKGEHENLRQALDTPQPGEEGFTQDAYYATDKWLTTLDELDQSARLVIDHLEAMLCKQQI